MTSGSKAALIVLNLALLVALGWAGWRLRQVVAPGHPPAAASTPAPVVASWDRSGVIASIPIFFEPPKPGETQAMAPSKPAPEIILTGVMVFHQEPALSVAFITVGGPGGEEQVVRTGVQIVGGLKVSSIGPGEMKYSFEGKERGVLFAGDKGAVGLIAAGGRPGKL